MPPGGVRRAGAGLLLLIPCWKRSTPSFVETAVAATMLDKVYAFLRGARWRVLSWTWKVPAATSLDVVYALAQPVGVRGGGAGAGRLLLLPHWTWSTLSVAPPGGMRGAGA